MPVLGAWPHWNSQNFPKSREPGFSTQISTSRTFKKATHETLTFHFFSYRTILLSQSLSTARAIAEPDPFSSVLPAAACFRHYLVARGRHTWTRFYHQSLITAFRRAWPFQRSHSKIKSKRLQPETRNPKPEILVFQHPKTPSPTSFPCPDPKSRNLEYRSLEAHHLVSYHAQTQIPKP
jgi:hypothetical protein